MRRKASHLIITLTLALAALSLLGAMPQQAKPPQPFGPDSYSGSVLVQGAPPPLGTRLFACIDNCRVYKSSTAGISLGGSYNRLLVSPSDRSLVGRPIFFYLENEYGQIQAAETAGFQGATETFTLNLSFNDPAPSPTPTPTVTPTASLPAPGDPMVTAIPRMALLIGGSSVLLGIALLFVLRRKTA